MKAFEIMKKLDRAHFLPEDQQQNSSNDLPLPIGHGQTTSQPSLLRFMIDELELDKDHDLLEVGAGSGYVTAILAHLSEEVTATERIKELVDFANNNLNKLGLKNFDIIHTQEVGIPGRHFDRIIVGCAAPEIPQVLINQLREDGIIILPVGTKEQYLWKVSKKDGEIIKEKLLPVKFVPLIE